MIDFIERILRMPRAVLSVMALLLLAGFTAYIALPKESFPAIDIPYFYVSVSQDGISPKDAEQLLARPIEDRLTGIDGLDTIISTSSSGRVSVFLEFDVNVDGDQALQDIRAELDGVSNDLPGDAKDPKVSELSISDLPVLSVAIYGDVPERTLIMRAKELQDALESLEDVREARLSGHRDEILEVQIDLLHLEAYGLTSAQLFDALAKNNMVVAGGTLDSGRGAFNLEVPGLISSAEEIYSLPLKTDGDTIVSFGDVATITRTFKDATTYAYVNGSPAITIGILSELDTNIIEVSDAVREATEKFTADWPTGVEYSFLLDQSVSTKNLYRSLEATVITAVTLVLIMCIATLGPRPAVLIGMSIPISFMMAFMVISMLGMSINIMTMFGLVIAVGVLVDDPIVVVEYAERKLSEGVPRNQAFILAARKMFVPVVSATATTLGAFVPLLFWPGIIGKFMSYLPIVVIVVMIASLISALIFMPVIGAFIAKNEMSETEKEAADIVMYPDKFAPEKVRGLTGVYVRVMARLLQFPIITLAIGFAIVGSIFVYYIQNPTGTEAFPAGEPEYGTISVVAVGNYSPIEIRDYLLEVEHEVLQVAGVRDVILAFGGGSGGLGGGNSPPNTIGTLSLQLQPWEFRDKADDIFGVIRQRVAHISGLEIQISGQENGPPAGKAINLRLESSDYETLLTSVRKVSDFVANELGDTLDVEDGLPPAGIDWKISFDRVAAAKFGIGVRELSPYVKLVTGGVNIGSYLPDGSSDELDIQVRLPLEQRSLKALDSIKIATAKGLVPVSNFITRTAVPKVGSITRRNGIYSMNVAADLQPGIRTDAKITKLKAWDEAQEWPEGTIIVYGGAEEQTNETNAFIVKAFGAAMFLIFFILLLEYNSFYQVFVTLSTVVMSVAGVLLGLTLTGMTFSAIMTGLGIVALTGIVVKNGIVLIDTYNHYTRDDGVEPIKAMLITTAQRVRPVLLTAIVTALGVVPMALNIEFDFIRREIVVGGLAGTLFIHLSAALVAGLLFSTALTLIMVPVMITAPSVIWRNLCSLGNKIKSAFSRTKRLFGFGKNAAAHPPASSGSPDADGTKKLVEIEQIEKNGVTIFSRTAAE